MNACILTLSHTHSQTALSWIQDGAENGHRVASSGKTLQFFVCFIFFIFFYVLDVVSITVYDRDTLLNIGSSVAQRKPDFEFLNAGGVFTVHSLPVALLSSVACELAPLRIVLLCVFLYLFYFIFYFSFDTCIVCNDYVRQKNTFGHWTTLH